jgi:hypothetical protein
MDAETSSACQNCAGGGGVRRFALLLGVVIIFSTSTFAVAGDKTERVYPGPGYGDRSDATGAVYLRKMAQCIVNYAPSSAENLLVTRPRSTQESDRIRDVSGRFHICFPNGIQSLSFGNIELRGFLAEILYLKKYPVDPNFSVMSHTEVAWPEKWLTASKQIPNLLPIYMMKFGSCVAAADPEGVANLLHTVVRSAEEKAVIEQLKPSLGSCLDKGRTFKLDAAILRALSAQGLYRSVGEWLTSSLSTSSPNIRQAESN